VFDTVTTANTPRILARRRFVVEINIVVVKTTDMVCTEFTASIQYWLEATTYRA
jgi:hypothetical protein